MAITQLIMGLKVHYFIPLKRHGWNGLIIKANSYPFGTCFEIRHSNQDIKILIKLFMVRNKCLLPFGQMYMSYILFSTITFNELTFNHDRQAKT